MSMVDELHARLRSSASLSPLSPLSSSASSLPSVYSPGSTRGKKSKHEKYQTKKYREKSTIRSTNNDQINDDCNLFDTTAFACDSQANRCLLDQSVSHIDGDENQKSKGVGNSIKTVLVAVRCRPRKRQRTKKQFATVLGVDKEVPHSRSQESSDSSSSSSGSDGRESNYRAFSSGVQRGVFEYSASREYDYTATYDAKIPPPCMQRPHRLYVQAPSRSGSASGRRCFDFDFIFPPWKKQLDVYDKCVHAQIHHVLESNRRGQVQHATIVAYGQTGTGKTYTMGMLSDFTDNKEQGLIPRALSQILEFAGNAEGEASSHVVTLSFLQIYLETIQDLLALPSANHAKPANYDSRRQRSVSHGDLPVRQSRDGAFYVVNLSEYEISTIADAHALLELAMRNRVLAATTKNKTSSRSHTLLTISIKRRHQGTKHSNSDEEDKCHEQGSIVDAEDELRHSSTISFVDLAGSERVDGALHFLRATRTRQEQRIREAKFINRSLSALGGVIAALAQPKAGSKSANDLVRINSSLQEKLQQPVENEHGQPHIRFRDSQLTKLLQSRLMGGRGRLLLIATVDDQPKNLSETLSTLKFASQCRRVELIPGSRLRGDRTNRLGRQKDLLDQAFNDLKMMHEKQEAALHSEYQARIQVLERELEAARAVASSSTPEETSIHLASYTALCSLVDMVCPILHGDNRHPDVNNYQSEDMLKYVAALYSRVKEALAKQPRDQPHTNRVISAGYLNLVPADEDKQYQNEPHEDKQAVSRKPAQVFTIDSSRHTNRMLLSPEQEGEFRAVARHLVTTQALDAFIISSDEDSS